MNKMTERMIHSKNEEELLTWLMTFSSHLPSIGKAFGVTPSEIASLNELIKAVKDDIRKGLLKDEDKIEKKNSMLKFVYNYIDRMEAHPGYKADEHGKVLGFEG